jgi:SsrA-binding protein
VARAKQVQEKRAQKRADASGGDRVVATNRRARYEYEIIETLECGIMLSGSEVKSLREGKAQIAESYARFDETELWLYQMHVPPWAYATGFGSHDPDRRRKLLAHRHELDDWLHETRTEPYTMVPLKLYFKEGKAKVELALAKGKKSQDRRQAIAKRDADRDMARAIRHTEKLG